jgi:hypothetical protein
VLLVGFVVMAGKQAITVTVHYQEAKLVTILGDGGELQVGSSNKGYVKSQRSEGCGYLMC